MPVLKSGKYEYQLTPDDLKTEQDAFQPGEGVIYLYMYIAYTCIQI